MIEGDIASDQRPDDTDMGKAARAAAREHQPDSAAGDESRQPLHVVAGCRRGGDDGIRNRPERSEKWSGMPPLEPGGCSSSNSWQAAGPLLEGRKIKRNFAASKG